MAYRDFHLSEFVKLFNLKINETNGLFAAAEEIECSKYLRFKIEEYLALNKKNDPHKQNQQLITYSVLLEAKHLLKPQISVFTKVNFDVDSEIGLNGYCDFLVSLSSPEIISHPVITIVESKHDNLDIHLGQCAAQMLAFQLFNEWENNQIKTIYGLVTNGTVWRFMKLVAQVIYLDSTVYHISYVEKILGILCSAIARTAIVLE